jgi:23S rRNA pseudouridine1911/1915/1917 synthase
MPKSAQPLQVLYEDNHLLAVVKPAGLATMGTPAGKPTLLEIAKQYIKDRYQKPGNVYLGVVSRLDAPVTGVVVLARTSKAARRLNEQFRGRDVEKTYWALVDGRIDPPEGRLEDWMAEDPRHRRMWVVGPQRRGAKRAELAYRTLRALGRDSWLEIELLTGRKHQIRVQLADRGHPVLGDRKYGSQKPWAVGIALHARRIVLNHPVQSKVLELEAPIAETWQARLGSA